MTDKQPSPELLATGSHGDYRWLASQRVLADLLRLCPTVILGKYVAVTSFDSGPLILSAEEIAAGWVSRKGIAYSPLVQSPKMLPHDLYDEWYIFQQPVDIGVSRLGSNIFEPSLQAGEVGDFVNYCFSLHRPDTKALTDLFWGQLERVRPESYIADNEYLTFVSRDEGLFAVVCEALSRPRA